MELRCVGGCWQSVVLQTHRCDQGHVVTPPGGVGRTVIFLVCPGKGQPVQPATFCPGVPLKLGTNRCRIFIVSSRGVCPHFLVALILPPLMWFIDESVPAL